MGIFHVLQNGTWFILQRQEKEVPTPYLEERPDRRPHLVSHIHQHFLKFQAPDIIRMEGLVVYENEGVPVGSIDRHRFTPRLWRDNWLSGWFVPPAEFTEDRVPGVYRVADVIRYEKSNLAAQAVMDRWFGIVHVDENGKPRDQGTGVWTEKPIDPNVQDPLGE